MNILINPLPMNYQYNGIEYPFHTDFREWIKVELIMADEEILPNEKAGIIASIIFPKVPQDIKLWDFLIWFYACGKNPPTVKSKKASSKKNTAIYSFEYDDGYIYSAFIEQYNIDLTTIDYLHWWKFKAMFKSLHDCKFTDILGYRSEEIDSKMSEKQKSRIKELKQVYGLPKSLSEQQKIEEIRRINERFMGK